MQTHVCLDLQSVWIPLWENSAKKTTTITIAATVTLNMYADNEVLFR